MKTAIVFLAVFFLEVHCKYEKLYEVADCGKEAFFALVKINHETKETKTLHSVKECYKTKGNAKGDHYFLQMNVVDADHMIVRKGNLGSFKNTCKVILQEQAASGVLELVGFVCTGPRMKSKKRNGEGNANATTTAAAGATIPTAALAATTALPEAAPPAEAEAAPPAK